MKRNVVGVFGTWRAKPNSKLYQSAMEIGRIAAQNGFSVLTGAYTGIMEAAPKGAKEVGGETVGYAWTNLDSALSPNQYLDEVRYFSAAEERIARLLGAADVCVFFPGRTGTVAELALATELRAKGTKRMPLVLIGEYWTEFFSWLVRSNKALGLPEDSTPPSELFTVLHTAEDFEGFLFEHEYHWNQ